MIPVKPYFDEGIDALSEDNLSKKRNKTKENPKGNSWFVLLTTQQHQHKFDPTLYGAKEVKNKLMQIFQNKCAFCECDTSAGAAYDIEHFRPKFIYYWLCYEWTNLLLSCQVCNRYYKQTHFPLEMEAYRVKTHPMKKGVLDKAACHIGSPTLASEKPLLLHPAIDLPNQHLRFLKTGTMVGLTEKGRISIEKYGLNRDELVLVRKEILLNIQEIILSEYEENEPSEARIKKEIKKILKSLTNHKNANKPFTGFISAILDNFDEFVLDNEDFGHFLMDKNIMKAAVKDFFKSGWLL
jgi:uncharacterized protein (TIGR02646 family)